MKGNSYIHLIRHGITEGNQKGWYYGQLDIPLAEEGFELLRRLKEQNIYPQIDGADCYTSGLLRTEQTFATIYGDIPHKTIPNLQEMNFGAWEGMSFKDIEASRTHRDAFAEWINSDGSAEGNAFRFPGGGDSVNSFNERIQEGVKELLGLHRLKELSCRHNGRDAVSLVVCHGGVTAAIMQGFFPAEKENFWQWIPEPGHGYTLTLKDGEAVGYVGF